MCEKKSLLNLSPVHNSCVCGISRASKFLCGEDNAVDVMRGHGKCTLLLGGSLIEFDNGWIVLSSYFYAEFF